MEHGNIDQAAQTGSNQLWPVLTSSDRLKSTPALFQHRFWLERKVFLSTGSIVQEEVWPGPED